MGHVLSFPLLCVINLAIYRYTVRKWTQSVPFDLPNREEERKRRFGLGAILLQHVLVNGDDMLFKAEKSLSQLFYQTCKLVGFKISVGKNYISPDCCMMNSQVFRRVSGRMERVGYLNQRLLLGMNVKKQGLSQAIPTQLGKDIGKMVSLAPWTGCTIPMCFRRFEQDCGWFHPNWFLPVTLGGYGVPMELAPVDLRITREQRLVAAMFVSKPSLALYSSRKAAGEDSLHLSDLDLLRYHWAVGDWVESEDELSTDEWLQKQCLWNRLSDRKLVDDVDEVSLFVKNQLRKDYRLRPMSLERLHDYLGARLLPSGHVPCPPNPFVRLPNMYDRWFALNLASASTGSSGAH